LESVVVGGANALDLVNVAVLLVGVEIWAAFLLGQVVGIVRVVGGSGLVEIEQAQKAAAFAANVPDLRDDIGTKGVFDVDAVVLVVGGTEVLVDGEDAAGRGSRARIAG
jgi:hypothetical protein